MPRKAARPRPSEAPREPSATSYPISAGHSGGSSGSPSEAPSVVFSPLYSGSPRISEGTALRPCVASLQSGAKVVGRPPAAEFEPLHANVANDVAKLDRIETQDVNLLSTAASPSDSANRAGPPSQDRTSSQEDSCTFHSPRSFPWDAGEEKGQPQDFMQQLPASADALNSLDAPQSPSLLQGRERMDLERQSISCHTQQSLQQPNQHQMLLLQQKGEQQQQQQHQQQQPAQRTDGATVSHRASPQSESEGEWIRVEENAYRESAAIYPGLSTASQSLGTAGAPSMRPPPLSKALLPTYSPPSQSSLFARSIGSANQTEEAAEVSGVVPLTGFVSGVASKGHLGAPPPCPNDSRNGGTPSEGPWRYLFKLSGYAKSLVRSASGLMEGSEMEQKHAPSCGIEEPSDWCHNGRNNGEERRKLIQGLAEWHRCLLEMYGGTVEDVTRLALQVLPAQATDDQSERRLLFLQGLFDLFCLYRAHFLSPPEGLLEAETLHQQWRLRAERSLRRSEAPVSSGAPRSSSLPPFACGNDVEEGALPLSLRLTLYGTASLALKIVRALQLLLEVNRLRTGGHRDRLALCLRLELLKLVLKLLLYSLTPFAFYCDEQSIAQAVEAQREKQMAAEADKQRPSYGRRTGRRIPPLPSAASQTNEQQRAILAAAAQPLPRNWGPILAVWLLKELKKNFSAQGLAEITSLLTSSAWRPILGEILYHLRPFIHLYLLKRANNSKSWTPWLAALFIEANSVSLLHGSPQVLERLSPVEAAELRRRLTGLPYALLRPPFFDKFLARPVEALDAVVRRVPLLNHFNVLDVFLVYRDLYFTTSNT